MKSTTGSPHHPIPRDGFALLLALMITSVLGTAVLGAQIVARQRLAAAAARNQIFQRRIAADAAVLHVLADADILTAGVSNLLVETPLPGRPVLAMSWSPASPHPAVPPDAITLRTAFQEAGQPARGQSEYLAREAAGQWLFSRWPTP